MKPPHSTRTVLLAAAWILVGAAIDARAAGKTTLPPRYIGVYGDPGGIYVEPLPPAETIPLAPSVIGFESKTTSTLLLAWRDLSGVESGYRIERQAGAGWVVVAQVGAVTDNIGTYALGNLRQDTEHCYRAVPFNGYGEPSSVPVGCTRTNRIMGPTTVVVRDRIGLIGELQDPNPPAFQWTSLEVAVDPGDVPAPILAPYSGKAPRKVIYVASDAQIDLSYTPLQIPAGITLASGRRGLVEGALLYSNVTTKHTMIEVVGNDVRVSGLRFRGPSGSTSEANEAVFAIHVRDALDVVIDHNEFFHFPGAGIKVQHQPWMIDFSTAYRMRITENFFHHNQRQNLGYGVMMNDASYAVIDKNSFDYNRHAIGSDGGRNVILDSSYGPMHGYAAYFNLVLPGHEEQVAGPITWQTHTFDVHGSEDGFLGTDYYDGWAGETIDIANNSFLGIQGSAFNVRGTPSDEARFHHNVTPWLRPMPGGSVLGADGGVAYYGWMSVQDSSDRDNIRVYSNVPTPEPRNRLAVGDFDGDGRDDVFLATGRAWYVSSAGLTEWRWLRPSTVPVQQLVFVDYDRNGRTDVLTRVGSVWKISWNGTGSPVTLRGAPAIAAQNFYSGADLIGDFSGDDVLDRLRFSPAGDRYFRVTDGRSGATQQGRHRM
jgi:hypothetical protein